MNRPSLPQTGDTVITRTGKTGVIKEQNKGVAVVLLDSFYRPSIGTVRHLEVLIDTSELRRFAANG